MDLEPEAAGGTEMEEDDVAVGGGEGASDYSDPLSSPPPTPADADPDFEPIAKPISKAKSKASSTTRNQKSKKTKKKAKGKGKAPPRSSSPDQSIDKKRDEAETTQEVTEPKAKKVLRAKEAHWADIPNWGKRKDCPLLELPMDVLDRCFGARPELGLREYVALAGTCTFFRFHLTDTVFQELCYTAGLNLHKPVHSYYANRDRDPEPATIQSKTPFSRMIADWKAEPEPAPKHRIEVDPEADLPYYQPRGKRSKWSQAQYTVYKEEKAHWLKEERERLIDETLTRLEQEKKKADAEDSYVELNHVRWKVLGKVMARRDGQKPVVKDDRGIPLVRQPESSSDEDEEQSEEDEEENKEEGEGQARSNKRAPMKKARNKRPRGPDSSDEEECSAIESSRPRKKVKKAEKAEKTTKTYRTNPRGKITKKWKVPDTSDESDAEVVELPASKKIHDYWPSKWRVRAAQSVNEGRINKTDSLKRFKVSEAELLTVSCVLIHNPMNPKQPRQLFYRAAVGALALRSHGDTEGHQARLAEAKEAAKMRNARPRKSNAGTGPFGEDGHRRKPRKGPYWWFYLEEDKNLCYCDSCDDGRYRYW